LKFSVTYLFLKRNLQNSNGIASIIGSISIPVTIGKRKVANLQQIIFRFKNSGEKVGNLQSGEQVLY